MSNGKFKVRNIDKLTTEQVKGVALNYRQNRCTPMLLGTMTYADDDYLYGEFTHTGENDIYIEIGCEKENYDGVIFSMEIKE